MRTRAFFGLSILALAMNVYGASPLMISEFLASNDRSISDEDGDDSDWIEIHNIATNTVNLAGWYLTDSTNDLRKWQFPFTNLTANGYLVVFASGKDRLVPGRPLHTNFKLDQNGEYLALVQPDGVNIATEFRPQYPPQVTDVSFGFATDAKTLVLVNTNAPARAIVPTNDFGGTAWSELLYPENRWLSGTLGVGYDKTTTPVDYNPFIGLNVDGGIYPQTVYIRVPFVVTNVAEIETLTLTMLYDDGMIAYLNGHEIARDNAPTVPAYNAGAPANRADVTSITPTNFNVTLARDFLLIGTNVLAFQGLNNGSVSPDILVVPKLTARTRPSGALTLRYFPTPTPGQANNDGSDVLGPLVSEVTFSPKMPQTDESITVTARVEPAFAPVGPVRLRYRVMYNAEVEIPMLDDGLHQDGVANDGVFGAIIPAGIATPGQMIRWFLSAADTKNVVTRVPLISSARSGPEYLGTIVPLAQTNNLSMLYWFQQNATAADTVLGTRASLFYQGEFYDNVGMRLHGQSSSGFTKKSYNVDFNKGYHFRYAPGQTRVSGIDLLTTYPDKAHMRTILAYETFRDAGTPYHFAFPVRVQQNGVFWGDTHFVEKGDEDYLNRLGMDPNGALYKMYNTLNVATGEKKTRQDEDTADLQALINGARLPAGAQRNAYLYDNINIPECIDYLAAQAITGNVECCDKNYYLYRDTEGTGEWQILPWDLDLSFGRVWSSAATYWDDVLYPTTFLQVGNNNTLINAIYATPEMRAMYFRRLRTLMEELLQPPGTPASQGKYERRIDELVAAMSTDAALDLAKWGTWCCSSQGPYNPTNIPLASSYQTLAQGADYIKTNYLPARRTFLFTNQVVGNGGEIPRAMPTNPVIAIGAIESSPASFNQLQEYVEIKNTNNFAIDISRWKVSGAIGHTFIPGTVIPANGTLYLSPDVRAFRARTAGPRGGQGLFVQGNYKGQLPARGQTVRIDDQYGRVAAMVTYPDVSSPAQRYLRITELMYHPFPLAGNTNSAEEFEYVELKNIGPLALDLNGVRFTNGILFNFSGSAVTNLAPGQTVLVVKNLATFAARYGAGWPVAGQYDGYLDNAGEHIGLIDAAGEEILNFDYDNSWYPITDGLGFSLVIVDVNAQPDDWGLKSAWRPSSGQFGSPGQTDPAPAVFTRVLINEALTRTLNVPDAVELYNPNTNSVDISGWYLTDDYGTPNKFRIPNGTVLPAGSYRVFTESNFNANPALPSSFSLSSDGDEVYLFGTQANGNLNGYVHGFQFGAAEEGVSFGRLVTSEGKEHFVAQKNVTLNATNAGPKIGPVAISEIMYHPPDIGTSDNTDAEFIELLNITATTVLLYDPLRPTNTWKITGGIDFTFPTNTALTPGQAALVVNIAPTTAALLGAFRTTYGIPSGVRLFGPYSGKLNNVSDQIQLRQPTPPLNNQVVPYPIVDSVEYSNLKPWPKAADGLGFSLQRLFANAYGNEPTNWVAAQPNPAAPTVTNGALPRITAQPQNQAVIIGQTVTVSAAVTGIAPLSYQWRLNGTNVFGGTNLSLIITNIQAQHAGRYELMVGNAIGFIFSDSATLAVRQPVAILQQPATVDVRVPPDPAAAPTTNVTFTVQAYSVAPVSYQWRRNGVDIAGATNSSYTVVAVGTNDLAYLSVVVRDDVSSATSTNFWLYPLVSPNFIDNPLSQSVVVGGTINLSTLVSGWPPPYTFEWRLGSAILTSETMDLPYSFFSVAAPTAPGSISYRAVIKNRALPIGRASLFAAITALADSDGDGIPDEWEARFGLNSTNALDRLADTDGDGMLNWQEYLAGTDPTNALSNLKLSPLAWSNGAVSMQFQAMSNKTYTIQYSTSLRGTNWQTLRGVLASATNRVEPVSDLVGNTNRFYRVVTPAR